MGEVERLAEVLSHALTDADEWVKSAEVANLVDAVLASDWLAAHVAAARADALREAAEECYGMGQQQTRDWLRARARVWRDEAEPWAPECVLADQPLAFRRMTWFTAAEGQPTTAHDTEAEAEAARVLLGERAFVWMADIEEDE